MMRIGIVANSTPQVARLIQELSQFDVLWASGQLDGAQLDCPTYNSFSQAMENEPVDMVIDGAGEPLLTSAMIVPAAAAQSLLGAYPKSESLVPSLALTDSASQLSAAIDKITAQVAHLEEYARQLSQVGGNLDTQARSILGGLERTGNILDSITRIAKRSKIIGLNSAIEAARVGEQGRGFAVVAEEIKSLADDSSQSVLDIEKILAGIRRSSSDFALRTGMVQGISESQQQTAQEISAMLQALKELGVHLQKLSQQA